MKQKLLEMVPDTVLFRSDEFIFVWFFKNGNWRQNRSSGVKTGLLRCGLSFVVINLLSKW